MAPRSESALRSSQAGLVAGVVGTLGGHPFDTLKVLMQTQEKMKFGAAARRVVSQDGITGLWRGVATPLVLRGGVKSAVHSTYGGANQMWQRWLPKSPDGTVADPRWYHHSVSGGLAGATAATFQTPAELIKIRIQTAPGTLPLAGRVVSVLRSVWQAGPSTAYRGYVPSLTREVPGYAFYFPFFETMKRKFDLHGKPAGLFVLGGVTGCLAWTLGYPADVVKSRMQAERSAHKRTTVREGFRSIVREAGVRGLYVGLSAALMRAWVTHAFTMMTYELVLDWRA